MELFKKRKKEKTEEQLKLEEITRKNKCLRDKIERANQMLLDANLILQKIREDEECQNEIAAQG